MQLKWPIKDTIDLKLELLKENLLILIKLSLKEIQK